MNVSLMSFQPHITWIIVLICEAISSFALAAFLVRLAADKWSFYRFQRQQRAAGFILTQSFLWKAGSGLPTHIEHTATRSIGYLSRAAGSVLPTHIEHSASWSIGYISRVTQALPTVIGRFKHSWPRPSSPVIPTSRPREFPSAEEPTLDVRSETSSRAESHFLPPGPHRAIRRVLWASRANILRREDSERMSHLQSHVRDISVTEAEIPHEAGNAATGVQFHPKGSSLAICGKRSSTRYELSVSESVVSIWK
jgi:hypothetical protein